MTETRTLAYQMRDAMRKSNRSQQSIARELDRAPARISELLRGLDRGKPLSDRLTLLMEMSDLLGLEAVLVPRERLEAVMTVLGQAPLARLTGGQPPSLFDEVFIDLADGDDDDHEELR